MSRPATTTWSSRAKAARRRIRAGIGTSPRPEGGGAGERRRRLPRASQNRDRRGARAPGGALLQQWPDDHAYHAQPDLAPWSCSNAPSRSLCASQSAHWGAPDQGNTASVRAHKGTRSGGPSPAECVDRSGPARDVCVNSANCSLSISHQSVARCQAHARLGPCDARHHSPGPSAQGATRMTSTPVQARRSGSLAKRIVLVEAVAQYRTARSKSPLAALLVCAARVVSGELLVTRR